MAEASFAFGLHGTKINSPLLDHSDKNLFLAERHV